MSKIFYLNLFHNGVLKFSGFKKDLENAEDTGKRPVMLPVKSSALKALMGGAKRFPYRLDEEKNIRKFGNIHVLVPTRDVPGLTEAEYKNSLYYKLSGSDNKRIEELEDEISSKEKVIGTLKKKVDRLESEEEERGKSKSRGGGPEATCPDCGESRAVSSWRSNGGLCPNCERTSLQHPEVVQR